MLRSSETRTGSDLTQLEQLARETHDHVKRVRVRAHRLCGLLNNQRSEAAPSEQEDGWFYFA
jgi:hypothetical protein